MAVLINQLGRHWWEKALEPESIREKGRAYPVINIFHWVSIPCYGYMEVIERRAPWRVAADSLNAVDIKLIKTRRDRETRRFEVRPEALCWLDMCLTFSWRGMLRLSEQVWRCEDEVLSEMCCVSLRYTETVKLPWSRTYSDELLKATEATESTVSWMSWITRFQGA